jgi:hypothetical protein
MPPETKTGENTDSKGNLPEEVTKVLEEIKSKLDNPPAAATPPAPASSIPSWQDQREESRKKLGFTEEQMRAHEELIDRKQAPVIENLGWNQLEKHKDLDKYKKEIEAELSIYPASARTPAIMEKVYFMVKGKHAESQPAPDPKATPRNPTTRVSSGPGYSGSDPGLPAGGTQEEGTEENLDDREKFVASKLGVTEKDYAKSRNVGRAIRELKIPDQRPVNSLADVELRRLQGQR